MPSTTTVPVDSSGRGQTAVPVDRQSCLWTEADNVRPAVRSAPPSKVTTLTWTAVPVDRQLWPRTDSSARRQTVVPVDRQSCPWTEANNVRPSVRSAPPSKVTTLMWTAVPVDRQPWPWTDSSAHGQTPAMYVLLSDSATC